LYKNKKLLSVLVICAFASVLLLATPHARGVQFYVATWSYPDEYGQGIDTWYAQSNRTGSWVTFEAYNHDQNYDAIEWNVSQVIRMMVWCTLNYTLLGISSLSEGLNYIKHNVTVTDRHNAIVFSKQNFTFDYNASYDGLYWYRHYVILDFSPLEGELYTVVLNCEIYY